MSDIPPKRNETPLNTMAIARATAGRPQPPAKAPHMTKSHPRQLWIPLSLSEVQLTGFSNYNLPTNLQMQREGTHKHPHDTAPTTSQEKCTRECACCTTLHTMWRNGVGALLGFRSQGDNKSQLERMIRPLLTTRSREYIPA